MGRRSQLLIATLVVGILAAGVATAGVPDPALSNVPNVVYSPGGSAEYVITVNGSEGPIDSANVQIVFSTEADGLVCWCVGQTHPIISGTTDASGEATFFIAAGGCIDPSLVASPPAVEVFANGIKLAEVGAVSADAVDAGGILPTAGWNPGPTCDVGLSDGTRHTSPLQTGVYSYCTDINSDGLVGLSDAVLLTVQISAGESCTAQ